MAAQHLTVLPPLEFPQIQLLRSTLDPLTRMVDRVLLESQLSLCCYESPESRPGACDSVPCNQAATVHHLALEQEFCAKHFRTVWYVEQARLAAEVSCG
jgi:hypothetical protein